MSLQQFPPKVKQSPPQDNAPVVERFPNTAAFLAAHPLPRIWRDLDPLVRKIPLGSFLGLLRNATIAGFSEDKVREGIRRLAIFHGLESHRCAACLHWTDKKSAVKVGCLGDDDFSFFVVCNSCHAKIQAGRVTPAMKRNLCSYGGGAE